MQDKGTQSIIVVYRNLFDEMQQIIKEIDGIDTEIKKLKKQKEELLISYRKKRDRANKITPKIDKIIQLKQELIDHMKAKIAEQEKKQKGGENDT